MLEKFLTVAVLVILVLFALHTNTAKKMYYRHNLEQFHISGTIDQREGLLEAL